MAEIPGDDDFDLECQIGLLGNVQEQNDASRKLYSRYREALMSYVCRKFGFLSEADAADAVQQTFIEIWRQVGSGTLDLNEPLKSWMFTVVRRRAIDIMRRNRPYIHQDDEVAGAIGDALSNTKVGEAWKKAQRQNWAREIEAEFREFVPTLPARQRLVASVMADFLPDWMGPQEISQEIYKRQSQKMTILEIKGAKQALMQKFQELLSKRGLV